MEKTETIVEFSKWLLKKGIDPNQYPLFKEMIIDAVDTYISQNTIQENSELRNQELYQIWKEGMLLLLKNSDTHAVFRGIKLSDYKNVSSLLIFKIELDDFN